MFLSGFSSWTSLIVSYLIFVSIFCCFFVCLFAFWQYRKDTYCQKSLTSWYRLSSSNSLFQLKVDVEVTLAEMEEHVMTITTLTPVLVWRASQESTVNVSSSLQMECLLKDDWCRSDALWVDSDMSLQHLIQTGAVRIRNYFTENRQENWIGRTWNTSLTIQLEANSKNQQYI